MINQHGSFRKAAKVLGVSQPAVTSAIRKLEDDLDTPLFDRSSKHAALTEAGIIVLRRAENILGELSALKTELCTLLKDEDPAIRVAFCLCEDLPVRIASEFTVVHPDIYIVMEQRNERRVIPALLNNEYDLGITFTGHTTHVLECVPFGRQEFGVFFPGAHPFGALDEIPVRQLGGEVLLFPAKESARERQLVAYFAENHVPLRSDMVKYVSASRDYNFASTMVRDGTGLAILPLCQKDEIKSVSARKLRDRKSTRLNSSHT